MSLDIIISCGLLLAINQFAIGLCFQENLAKAGKAIQAILDATGKNKGGTMIFCCSCCCCCCCCCCCSYCCCCLAKDQHHIQGRVEMHLVAPCYRSQDKLRTDGPLASYADFTFTLELQWSKYLYVQKSVIRKMIAFIVNFVCGPILGLLQQLI